MKTFVYLDPSSDHDLVATLRKAFASPATVRGTEVPDKAMVKGQWWTDTMEGYEIEFGYMLTEIPLLLRSAPIVKVVIKDSEDEVVGITDGLYEDTPGIRCQITSSRATKARRVCFIRIETVGLGGAEAITGANEFFTGFKQNPPTPSTPWVPIAPIS